MRGLALFLLTAAWTPPAWSARVDTEAQLKSFLDGLDARLESLNTARQLEFYYQLKGLPAPNLARYQDLHRELFADPAAAGVLDAWRDRVADPALKRRIQLYRDVYLDFMYDTFRLASAEPATVSSFTALQVALDREIASFRPLYGGERVGRAVVQDALRREPDRAKRREAFLSGREVSAALAPRLQELLRRAAAMHRQMGFPGTVAGRLQGMGLGRAEVEALFARLEERTREPYRRLLAAAAVELGVERLEPWDLAFWAERQAGYPEGLFDRDRGLPRLLTLVRGLGFEPDQFMITVEHANMANAGWNIPIRMGVEARLLLNPTQGKAYYDTLFHEYGHALHEALIRQETGTFRTDRPGAWAEGMAEVLADFGRDPDWQREGLGLSGEAAARARRGEGARRLVRLRQLLFRNAFEYAAFDDPDQDLPRVYARLMERVNLVSAPPDPPWADDLFLIQPQVYVQNYVLAALIAAQVHAAMRSRLGPALFPNPKAAAFLTGSFFRHGAARDWRELLAEATGGPLAPDAYLEDLLGAVGP